ncbi:phosphatase PAP2 family protein [candidate division KSB1 bacterium]|nr:phosphatase PAP2 family protein [candidate division KSB1 bacterium]RQW07111.1 MAG: phosphatase PAP2 family protein [candidate division KSB1 bacterium]
MSIYNKKRSVIMLVILVVLCTHAVAFEPPFEKYSSIDNLILGSTALLGITSLFIEHKMSPLTPEQASQLDRNTINRFDRSATCNLSERAAKFSDYGMLATLLLPVGLLTDARIGAEPNTLGYLYLETIAVTAVLTELTKVTVGRIRPWVYNERVPLEQKKGKDAKKSFFSGHTSLSFAGAVLCAKVYSDYHPDSRFKPYIWAGTIGLASTVAYWRVRAGRHFPSDVVVGALVGSAAAYFIPKVHKAEQTSAAPAGQTMWIQFNFCF